MTRYVAFLRGISPMNLKMPELKRCFESAGFTEVKTLLSSGNVVFNAKGNASSVEHRAEEAMSKDLGHKFYTIVRSISDLGAMIETDPYEKHSLPEEAKGRHVSAGATKAQGINSDRIRWSMYFGVPSS